MLLPITKGDLSLTLSSYSCQSRFIRKILKTCTEIPASFRCNLLLLKFLFEFLKLRVIISDHISARWAFTSSTFSLKLSAQQTLLELMILLFSVLELDMAFKLIAVWQTDEN